jgi:hypothetical protein
MNDIRALLRTAARRLELTSFIDKLHWVAIVVAVIALGLMIADRLPSQAFVPWVWVGPVLTGIALTSAVMWWMQRRASEQHVAVVVDERLELREKLSTALLVQGRSDAFAQAAIEDAVNVARDGRTHELVSRRFGVQPPRLWFISPLIVLAAVMISFLKPLDLFRQDLPQAEITNAKLEAQQAIDVMVKTIKESPALEKELADALAEASKEGTDPNAPFKKPEDAKRDALKKATDINKKLDELINGEKGKTAEAIEKALNQLQPPQEDGDAKELAEALAKGDFQRAQEAIKNLQEKAEKGQLNEEDKKKAAEALEQIAKQLNDMAKQQEQLKEALQQAGMDPNLANNPQALQQALQNAQNLNQQQKQELQQMAQAQQAAAQMCQGLAGACQNMAAGLNGQQGQMGQGAQQAGAQLGDMEALQQLLQEAMAAQGQCQGMCQGLGQGMAMSQGNGGMGNRGRGRGGKAPIAPTPTGTKQQKADVNTVEGDIIAKQLFDGEQIRGESKAQLIKVIENERKGFDEGLTEDQVHRKYQEAQKHYFGELEKLTKALKEEAKSAPSSGEKPAEGEGDAKPADPDADPE